ncbi:MAG: hypothetical protein Kapaf2KO_01860 [Candidatus Kapaibacteriales bacterium]
MRISGFGMGKNVSKLYYPIVPAIKSILPIVDEYIVALGDSDEDDTTREEILSINDPKIKIIDTVWDIERYPRGTEHAHQTDIAMKACSGDWLFYLQSDEVVHEKYLSTIVNRCKELLDNKEVEGLLFKYRHFWGDYYHYNDSHSWYPHEIRIVRNYPEIHSWESAQSFRRIPGFDGKNYRQQEGTYKLKVASVEAYIYHYGWVRPPKLMQSKKKSFDTNHNGIKKAAEMYKGQEDYYDYGPLDKTKNFMGTHPEVMKEKIAEFDWADRLRSSGPYPTNRDLMKHERLNYRILTWIEDTFRGGKKIGGFNNFELLDV